MIIKRIAMIVSLAVMCAMSALTTEKMGMLWGFILFALIATLGFGFGSLWILTTYQRDNAMQLRQLDEIDTEHHQFWREMDEKIDQLKDAQS